MRKNTLSIGSRKDSRMLNIIILNFRLEADILVCLWKVPSECCVHTTNLKLQNATRRDIVQWLISRARKWLGERPLISRPKDQTCILCKPFEVKQCGGEGSQHDKFRAIRRRSVLLWASIPVIARDLSWNVKLKDPRDCKSKYRWLKLISSTYIYSGGICNENNRITNRSICQKVPATSQTFKHTRWDLSKELRHLLVQWRCPVIIRLL